MSSLSFNPLQIAEEEISAYDDVIRQSHEAQECLECEEVLERGLRAFKWVEDSERQLTQLFHQGKLERPEDFDDQLRHLYTWWVEPCALVRSWIQRQHVRGFQVARDDEFRAACLRAEEWLARDEFLDLAAEAFNEEK